MPDARLTEEQVAEVRRRRSAVRASLAAEGLYLTPDEEALFEQFDRERLTADQRHERILAYSRARRAARRHAAE